MFPGAFGIPGGGPGEPKGSIGARIQGSLGRPNTRDPMGGLRSLAPLKGSHGIIGPGIQEKSCPREITGKFIIYCHQWAHRGDGWWWREGGVVGAGATKIMLGATKNLSGYFGGRLEITKDHFRCTCRFKNHFGGNLLSCLSSKVPTN